MREAFQELYDHSFFHTDRLPSTRPIRRVKNAVITKPSLGQSSLDRPQNIVVMTSHVIVMLTSGRAHSHFDHFVLPFPERVDSHSMSIPNALIVNRHGAPHVGRPLGSRRTSAGKPVRSMLNTARGFLA